MKCLSLISNSLQKFACFAVLCLTIVFGAAPVTGQEYKIYHFDQPVPLTLNTNRVAVHSRANGFLNIEPLSTEQMLVRGAQNHAIPGWFLLQVEAKVDDFEISEKSLDQLLPNQEVDFVAPVFFDRFGGPFIPTADILVRFEADVERFRQLQILEELNVGEVRDTDWARMSGAYRIRSSALNGFAVIEQANRLAQRPEVRWAEPDMIFTGRSTHEPNDPLFVDCWGLHNVGQMGACQPEAGLFDMDMDLPEAWDMALGDESVRILILDTGVEQNHPDLNQVPGQDFTAQGPGDGGPFNACDNHGTAVAGCVTAIIDNELGAVGVAPECRSASARTFVSLPFCNGSWSGQFSWGADALAWAETIGVRVSNNSNSYGGSSSALEDKYMQTRNDGMIHFASAGNDSSEALGYPAVLDSVHAVAALNPNGELADFSNFGPGLAYSSPGQYIMTTDRLGADGYAAEDYVCVNGTSFASPYAAGVAALVISVNPALSAFQVEQILNASSTDLGEPGYDTTYGWGFVNASQAIKNAVCPFPLGDVNNDSQVNLLDVDPFVTAITNGDYRCEADINGDGSVDLLDVEPFVMVLGG